MVAMWFSRDTTDRGQETAPSTASRGQVLVLFALFLVGMLGILGLAMDLGMAFAQRRTMQNAADAGALAGARAVARWTASSPTTANPEVNAFVASNRMDTTPTVDDCFYVDYNNGPQGACSATVPPPATGVSVTVREVHPTFFIRVVPLAPDTVTVTATATAHVERYNGFPGDAPFMVCGVHSWAVYDKNGVKYPGQGADIPILQSGSTTQFNSSAFGVTFYVHNNQMSQTTGIRKDSGCDSLSARFNGITDQFSNAGKQANSWLLYTEGTASGPVLTAVNGAQGCKVGEYTNCVMLLPILTNNPSEAQAPGPKQLYAVTYGAFYVTDDYPNGHFGRLIEDYIVSGPSDETWCRDCNSGAAVVRLSG